MNTSRYITLLGLLLFIPFVPTYAAPDINGYEAQYECRAGNPNCDVDVIALTQQTCQQTITVTTAPTTDWSAINWNNNVICIEAGNHSGRGPLQISVSGSSGVRKVLKTNVAEHPIRQSGSDRSTVRNIVFAGADYWLIRGLHITPNFAQYISGIDTAGGSGAANNIIDSVVIENTDANGVYFDATDDNNAVQNSVIRRCAVVPNQDWNGIGIFGGATNIRAVNNEIYGCTHGLFINKAAGSGHVFENNDVYIDLSQFTDCSGTYTNDPNSVCSDAESLIALKSGGNQDVPVRVLHNRIWGARQSDTNICCGSGQQGESISITGEGPNDPGLAARFVLVKDNIVWNGQKGIANYWWDSYRNSLVGNLVYDIRPFRSDISSPGMDTIHQTETEFYLNTLINTYTWFTIAGTTNNDVRCNVAINSGAMTGNAGAASELDSNVFLATPMSTTGGSNIATPIVQRVSSTGYVMGDLIVTGPSNICTSVSDSACYLYRVTQAGTTASTAPPYCTSLGCTTTDGTLAVHAVRGPYVFRRKLWTVPGGEPVVVPYATVHTNADDANFCPSTFANRTGIGINDDTGWSGIFAQDLKGTTRNGTPGAFQASGNSGGGGGTQPNQTPYNGTPSPIPGLIEIEHYDNGGEGIAYHDTSPGNGGDNFRANEGVDLYISSENGYHVGWTQPDEWLEYTVDVTTTGAYTLELRVASNGQGGNLHLAIEGTDITGSITVPNTGGWDTWQTITRSGINLTAGTHVLRLAFDTAGPTTDIGNINYLRFTQESGGGTGTISREYWTGIPGDFVTDLTNSSNYPNNPSGSDQLTAFEAPTDWADAYGTRVRGYVHAPVSGSYIFWIASDDYSELWLSTDDNPANKVLIASVSGWTASREWNKYASQQSAAISLIAGQRYYIEVLQKEGTGGDNLAVAWQLPDGTFEGPIPGSRLSPFVPAAGTATGTVLRHYWLGIAGDFITDLTNNPSYPNNPTAQDQLISFEAPTDWADNYGTRVQGYIHPPVTGSYSFWIASDDYSELWLSTDHNAANKALIATVNGWTAAREWNKYASQQSALVTLTAGQKYYIEALQKEGVGGDNLAVGWQLPDGTFEGPVPGSRLSPASP